MLDLMIIALLDFFNYLAHSDAVLNGLLLVVFVSGVLVLYKRER